MSKFQCLVNDKPCIYKPESNLGWDKWEYSSLEDASKYMSNYLGDFWPKGTPFPLNFKYNIFGDIFEIKEVSI